MAKTNFPKKNENRRAHRAAVASVGRREALDARDRRRALGGAFGNEDKSVFNALRLGTTAAER